MANNTFTKGYANGNALTEAQLDTAFQSLKLDVSNTDLATTGSTSGQVFTSNGSGVAASFQTALDPKPNGARNYGLAAATSSGSILITLKTAAGSNPSGSDVVDITFGSSGSSTGLQQTYSQNASLTLTVTASATLGLASATTGTLYVYAIRQSSSALRLGVSSNGAYADGSKHTTVTMAASADSWPPLYSNASVGTYPVVLLATIKASHTSGSWNAIYSINLTSAGATNTNWVSYTPTGNWSTNVTYTGKWRRVGDSMEINAAITCSGAPTTANCVILIPTPGFTIDTAKLTGSLTNRTLGSVTILDAGTNAFVGEAIYSTTTSVLATSVDVSSTHTVKIAVTPTSVFTLGNTDVVMFDFRVPITEFAL